MGANDALRADMTAEMAINTFLARAYYRYVRDLQPSNYDVTGPPKWDSIMGAASYNYTLKVAGKKPRVDSRGLPLSVDYKSPTLFEIRLADDLGTGYIDISKGVQEYVEPGGAIKYDGAEMALAKAIKDVVEALAQEEE